MHTILLACRETSLVSSDIQQVSYPFHVLLMQGKKAEKKDSSDILSNIDGSS